jgi:hypothetical protein
MGAQGRCKPGYLGLPVGQQSRGHHYQCLLFRVDRIFLFQFQEEGDHLHGFSQSHVIRDNAAKADPAVAVHPGVTPMLIRAQLRCQSLWQRDILYGGELGHQPAHLVGQHDRCSFVLLAECRLKELVGVEWLVGGKYLVQLFDIRLIHIDISFLETDQSRGIFHQLLELFGREQLPRLVSDGFPFHGLAPLGSRLL